jgi:hypothetical protein
MFGFSDITTSRTWLLIRFIGRTTILSRNGLIMLFPFSNRNDGGNGFYWDGAEFSAPHPSLFCNVFGIPAAVAHPVVPNVKLARSASHFW